MNRVKWLLENDVFDEDLQPLIDEIQRQGMEVKVQRHRPFDTEREDISTWYPPDACVVFYGSIEFARQIQRRAPWVPGVYCTWDNYRCTHYYPAFGESLLNKDYVMLPLGELERRGDFLYDTIGRDDCIFVRPDRADKIFTGKVVHRPDLHQDVELFKFYDVQPHELCVVSSPKNIIGEWRFVIVDDRIVAWSEYKPKHNRGVEETVVLAACEFLGDKFLGDKYTLPSVAYRPGRAWVMDVCQTSDFNIHVLEVGAWSVAGLYDCDPEPIVRAVSEAALDEWKEINEP